MRRWLSMSALIVACYLTVSALVRAMVPPPVTVGTWSPWFALENGRFLVDDSFSTDTGQRRLRQQIFDAVFDNIAKARTLIVVDMFLFNAWQGPTPETHRLLSTELRDALLAARERHPQMDIIVVTDPINTVYGGAAESVTRDLSAAGIAVLETCLDSLQDSNPVWSGLYRGVFRWFGNAPGDTVPNSFGDGRVSLRSYLRLLNFKANHRKLLVTDNDQGLLTAVVTSANPHDASSAHQNVALEFTGGAAAAVLRNEQSLLTLCQQPELAAVLDDWVGDTSLESDTESLKTETYSDWQASRIRVLSESAIKQALLNRIGALQQGDSLDMSMFYLSERELVNALTAASRRGAQLRVLLDINRDAFGHRKNGVPNRPVAAELVAAGVAVRWCSTQGEQCHAKWTHLHREDRHDVFLGSANLTRRNLDDFNLETDVQLQLPADAPLMRAMTDWFEREWSNSEGHQSDRYEQYGVERTLLRWQYRFMEASGIGTF